MAKADVSTDAVAELDSDDVVSVATLSEEIGEVIEEYLEFDHEYVVGDESDCRESNGHLHFYSLPPRVSSFFTTSRYVTKHELAPAVQWR